MSTFDPAWLSGYDLIYFKLHGLPREVFWYGDEMITALSIDQIRAANLRGAVVYVANCNLWQKGPGDPRELAPMLLALLQAGARAVIGGPGENYAKSSVPFGADHLGQLFCRALKFGFTPTSAFQLAYKQFEVQAKLNLKRNKKLTKNEHLALKDTLEFRIFEQLPEVPK